MVSTNVLRGNACGNPQLLHKATASLLYLGTGVNCYIGCELNSRCSQQIWDPAQCVPHIHQANKLLPEYLRSDRISTPTRTWERSGPMMHDQCAASRTKRTVKTTLGQVHCSHLLFTLMQKTPQLTILSEIFAFRHVHRFAVHLPYLLSPRLTPSLAEHAISDLNTEPCLGID